MKIINFRTFLYSAACALIGAFVCVLFCINAIAGSIIMSLLIIGNIVLLIIFRKKFKYAVAFAIGAIALFVMIILTFVMTNDRYADIDYTAVHSIEGRVYSVEYDAGEYDIILENTKIDGTPYSGRIEVRAESDTSADSLEFLHEGYEVKFDGIVYHVELIRNRFINTYSTRSNIRYLSYINSDAVTFEPRKLNVLVKFQNTLKEMLVDRMGNRYASIAYGMLTGDRSGLSTESATYFGAAGIGHVLAISGLHIGFIISLLSLVMRRLSPKIKVPIIISVISLYAVFAGFSFSAIRACIMSGVCLFTLINGQRSDLLNNISLAFTLLVAMSPFAVFEAGFLMSFSAVFGIACFSNTFTRWLRKIKFPKFLASAVSVSAAAQIGIMPCLLYFFHNLPLYSIIANIVLMPLITITFTLLLLCCLICLMISNGALLILPQSLLIVLDGAAQFTASLPFSQITLYVSGWIFLLLPLYFIASKYLMLPKFKWIFVVSALICCVTVCSLSYITLGIDNAIIPINSYYDVTTVVRTDGKTIVIGDCRNGKQIERTLTSNYLGNIDAIYLTSINEYTAQAITYLYEKGKCGTVYCPYTSDISGLTTLTERGVSLVIFDRTDVLPTVSAEYNDDMTFACYSLPIIEGKKALFLGVKTQYTTLDSKLLDNSAVLRCKTYISDSKGRIFLTNLNTESSEQNTDRIYCLRKIGEYIYDYSSGEVFVKKLLDN